MKYNTPGDFAENALTAHKLSFIQIVTRSNQITVRTFRICGRTRSRFSLLSEVMCFFRLFVYFTIVDVLHELSQRSPEVTTAVIHVILLAQLFYTGSHDIIPVLIPPIVLYLVGH